MIEVEGIRKQFGPTVAVDGVSFRVDRSEVVGFLGPNGAGKTTTMRILTGYLRPRPRDPARAGDPHPLQLRVLCDLCGEFRTMNRIWTIAPGADTG